MENKILFFKKLLFVMVIVLLMGSVLFIAYSQTLKLGDVNASGTVDIVDALLIAQYSAGMPPAGFNVSVADVNCDKAVNILDALVVARYSASLIATITCASNPTPTPSPIIGTPVAGHLINALSAMLVTTGYESGSTKAVQGVLTTPGYNTFWQTWEYRQEAAGYYSIISKQTGMVLTVENGSMQPGAYVVAGPMQAAGSNLHQQWQFIKSSTGYFKIVNRQSGLCLAVENASLLENARLVQAPDVNQAIISEILWGTAVAAPQPCPTCCDYSGAFCIGVNNNLVVKENVADQVDIQVRAGKVLMSGNTGSNIMVKYTLRGTAVNGEDVELLSGQISVYARNYFDGDTVSPPADGKIYIKPKDDLIPEGVETLFIDLSFPGATVTNNGVVYIVDEDKAE